MSEAQTTAVNNDRYCNCMLPVACRHILESIYEGCLFMDVSGGCLPPAFAVLVLGTVC